ncbi:MAG: hypothetical protein U1E65_01985 [Myxococcota bacterium]
MLFRRLFSLVCLGALATAAIPAFAKEPSNLKVLAKDYKEKELDTVMKEFNKGLGVKCEACHVKGKMESDDVKSKEAGRDFFKKVIGNKDEAARKAALADLLKAIDVKEAKDEAKMWAAVDKFKKQ